MAARPPVRPPAHNTAKTVVSTVDGNTYRCSAQGFVVNERGWFLAGTPMGGCNRFFRQTVQGGINEEETDEEALAREFLEEVSLTVGMHLEHVCKIDPLPQAGENADEQTQEEIANRRRQQFRYPSNTWRKEGIVGQELVPHLYFAKSEVCDAWNCQPRDLTVPQEFKHIQWLPLNQILQQTPPSKKNVLTTITPLVRAAAEAYLRQHYPDAVDALDTPAIDFSDPANRPAKAERGDRGRGRGQGRGRGAGRGGRGNQPRGDAAEQQRRQNEADHVA